MTLVSALENTKGYGKPVNEIVDHINDKKLVDSKGHALHFWLFAKWGQLLPASWHSHLLVPTSLHSDTLAF